MHPREQKIITILDTKNNERKDLPMDETVRTLFQGLERRGEFVFSTAKGRAFNEMVIHNAFHEAMKETGISDFRFHDLRHTFASNLVMAGLRLRRFKS